MQIRLQEFFCSSKTPSEQPSRFQQGAQRILHRFIVINDRHNLDAWPFMSPTAYHLTITPLLLLLTARPNGWKCSSGDFAVKCKSSREIIDS
jgi:hypothetical protein